MKRSAKARSNTPEEPARAKLPTDQDALALEALASAVLAGEFRPRAASVRRLAQGVITLQQELEKARNKARNAAKPKKKKKNRKLARIPGQKTGA